MSLVEGENAFVGRELDVGRGYLHIGGLCREDKVLLGVTFSNRVIAPSIVNICIQLPYLYQLWVIEEGVIPIAAHF